jgi:hypothetical protein
MTPQTPSNLGGERTAPPVSVPRGASRPAQPARTPGYRGYEAVAAAAAATRRAPGEGSGETVFLAALALLVLSFASASFLNLVYRVGRPRSGT